MTEQWLVLVIATQAVRLFITVMIYLTVADADAVPKQNYVKPIRGIQHLIDQVHLSTLEDYASQQDQYFVNDTIFYLYPGMHTLSRKLYVNNVHNMTIHGLSGSEPVTLVLGSLVSIFWKNCWCIKISSVDFHLANNFTHSIVFEFTQSVQLSNISMFGNGSSGCSSILSQESTLDITNSKFIGIKGLIGSALMISDSSIVTFTRNNRFENNEANIGGAIYLHNSVLIFNGNSHFINNTANGQSTNNMNDNLCNPSSSEIDPQFYLFSGGAILSIHSNLIMNRFAQTSVPTVRGSMKTQGHNFFMDMCHSKVYSYDEIIVFYKNVANQGGGAIKSLNSNIIFSGTLCFILNDAKWGGAINLDADSELILTPTLAISFIMNSASEGGALYVGYDYDYPCLESSFPNDCFFSIGSTYSSKVYNISLLFVNNSADTGSTLYGGDLNKCDICHKTIETIDDIENKDCSDDSYQALETFMDFSSIFLHESSVNNISSLPQTLQFCDSDVWNSKGMDIYLGEEVSVTLKALGQTSSAVNATLLFLGESEYFVSPKQQQIGNTCTEASFRLYSDKYMYDDLKHNWVSINLYHACRRIDTLNPDLNLKINILPCPLGFALSKKEKSCVCEMNLSKFVQNCYIDFLSIERTLNNFWLSTERNSTIILHEFSCPLDFCKVNPVNVTLDKSDEQCDFNRTGTLCGRCLKHYSLALGSLHCLLCGNHHVALIIPFALAGILLVAIILLLHLTVAVGTLNGLLFYANIIQANHQAFFPRATINFFTIFTSWLNLDLGIETCFYEGMDAYVYSWLQFLFPFYVWFLIGCIILVSHYSQSFARSLGQNPVAVLATLLLMSFSKILRAIISPLSWTYLTYYNSTHEKYHIIWLYDGNLEFFGEPKHTALGVFAITVLIVFILPYILLLTCAQWLQACSNWRALSWLNNLKPLLDAYHAPYKTHTRYRTGLLLLIRMGLFLTFAINTLGSESINILAVSSVTTVLLGMQVGRVYEHWWNDMLECSFLINLGIFSAATFYIKEEIKHDKDDQSQLILSNISVGVAFATFFGILLFHVYFIIKSTTFWKIHMHPHVHMNQLLTRMLRTTIERENAATLQENTEILAMPTSTIVDVDLREPLIDATCH